MSVNNITNENNKKLFESRLQMKQNSNSINKISFEKKSNNNINVSFLSSSQPFTKVIFHKKRKIQSILENSLINNINNNSSINKKIIKIKKNRNKKKKISLKINTSHNKSNILIKDITFFRLKDSFYISDRRNRTILSVNKRMTQQNSINKSMGRKSRKKNFDSNSLNIKKDKRSYRNVSSRSSTRKKINSIEYKNNNKFRFKDKYTSKFKLKSHFKNSRNSSSIRNNSHYQDSFLIQKIKKIKYKKRPNINSISMTNNSSIMEHSSNRRGRNTRNNNNKNGLDISIGQILHTQRNLFADKNIKKIYKNTFGEIKYKNNKLSNNNSMLKKQNHTINYDDNKAKANKSKKKFNNSSINSSNLSNKFLLKNKEKKMSRNYKNNINKKHTFNIFNKKGDTLEFKALNIQKKNYENKKFKKLNKNNKINHQNILRNNNNKNLEKKQRIIEDNNNGTSTKTNDEFFSEEKEKKINESSIEEDSGILSMDEIEDIIKYNNMENINKDDNYLFKFEDHSNFIKTYKKKIINLFFDDKNHLDENYKENKIKMKKKILEINSSINNGYHRNNFKDLKVFTYNNTSKIKKNC
jgi:hypothetical protein